MAVALEGTGGSEVILGKAGGERETFLTAIAKNASRRGRDAGLRDRPSGPWGNRLHQGQCVATFHPPSVALRGEFESGTEWTACVGSYARANGARGLWALMTVVT